MTFQGASGVIQGRFMRFQLKGLLRSGVVLKACQSISGVFEDILGGFSKTSGEFRGVSGGIKGFRGLCKGLQGGIS